MKKNSRAQWWHQLSDSPAAGPTFLPPPDESDYVQQLGDHRALLVTPKSKLIYKLEIERQAFAFRFEALEKPDTKNRVYKTASKEEYEAWLIFEVNVGDKFSYSVLQTDAIICKGSLLLRRFRRFGRWTLIWLWLHPWLRGKDFPATIWSFLESRYPRFYLDPPISDSMQKAADRLNLSMRIYSEPDTILAPKSFQSEFGIVELREATINDMSLLKDSGWFDDSDPEIATEYFLTARDRSTRYRLALAFLNERLVGSAWLDLNNAVEPHTGLAGVIDHVRIFDDYQRKGIGTRLIAFVEDMILSADCKVAEIGVNRDSPDALKLYIRLGYRHKNEFLHTTFPAISELNITWGRYDNALVLHRDLTKPREAITEDELNNLLKAYRIKLQLDA